MADVYVNDAFGTAHRAHASTTIIADFFPNEKMFGYLIAGELNSIDTIMNDAKKPFTAIMGGAKVSTKITIIEQLLKKADNLIIGGGMTYTFIKALGGKTGASLVEEDKLDLALSIIEKAKANNVKLILPVDSVNGDKFAEDANVSYSDINQIPEGLMGLDVGEKTVKLFAEVIENSATILWNGPVGVFEMAKFENGTKKLAESIARATAKGAFSLVGGGDSVAAVNKYDMAEKVSYVSTGGGALLEYMEGNDLPGIKAIRG
jgi:phosphoglycerate kinase